jgi:tRNA (cmo5U34)-methyltransferase
MSHSVSHHLRIDTAEYDAIIRRFIPGYEEMIARAAALVSEGEPALVLDLGAGTGALSEQVLTRTTTTRVALWDVDPAMLDGARQRLARFGSRAEFVAGSFHDPLPAADRIMASLALHHVTELAAKRILYARIGAALRPGGRFVNADATVPREAPRNAVVYKAVIDHMAANGIDTARAWQHLEEWSGEDRYYSLEEELESISQAGLVAGTAWQGAMVAVTVGRKA